MIQIKPFVLGWLLLLSLMWGCQPHHADPQPGSQTAPSGPTGSLRLQFDNVVGSQDLKMGSGTYTNGSGEAFSVTTLNYYVTNIRLQRADGSFYTVPQDSSYFLVKESDPASQLITLKQIPVGDYTGVSYLLGVDSLRNTLGVDKRTGVLDPAGGMTGGMYWDWNSGYIHFKLEGTSPVAPISAVGKVFLYHIGLFGGYRTRTLNNLRTIRLPFGSQPVSVATDRAAKVQIKADVLKVFDGPTRLRIQESPDIMISDRSADVATNYATMFRVDAIQQQ